MEDWSPLNRYNSYNFNSTATNRFNPWEALSSSGIFSSTGRDYKSEYLDLQQRMNDLQGKYHSLLKKYRAMIKSSYTSQKPNLF